ncbi:MAG TPA: type II secretion system protein [Usitatibacter sp.]|nr:type II secretion system protein [Usitatibacter sp.]
MRGERAIGRLQAFTLVELMVTVAVVGLLASVALPVAQVSMQRQKEHELRIALREIRGALDAYKLAFDEGRIRAHPGDSGFPPTLEALVEGVEDQRSPEHVKICFLQRVPRDPFAEASLPASSGWGKRSYHSTPEAPREGADVFDVYSLAPGMGLNGVAYRQW